MKKKILFLLVLFAALVIPFGVNAEELKEGARSVDIMPISIEPTDTEVKEELFLTGSSVSATGYFDGSSFFAGESVTSDATVNGISFIAGATADISGEAEYGFYAGSTVDINSSVRDLFSAGAVVTIKEDAKIARDAYLFGSQIKIYGNIGRNAYLAGSIVELKNTTIVGNLTISADEIKFLENVTVTGTLKYNEEAQVESLDNVKAAYVETYKTATTAKSFGEIASSFLISLVGMIIVAFVFSLIAPKSVEQMNEFNDKLSIKEVLKRLLYGFVSLIIIPIILVFLIATVIGMQLGVITFALYIIASFISALVTGYITGDIIITKLFKKKRNTYLSILIGVPVITLISYIPYIGGFIGFLSILLGLGVIIKLVFYKEA